MSSLPDPGHIALVAHDAGGAEVLSSYVRRQRPQVRIAVAGPAESVFARKLGTFTNHSVDEALHGASALVTGTSMPATLELDAISEARRRGLHTTALLEHWINYRQRFIRDGLAILPDDIWVLDDAALVLAREELPDCHIRHIDNPYRQDCLEELAELGGGAPVSRLNEVRSLLYVTEPTSEHAVRMFGDAHYWGYTEVEALASFVARIPSIVPNARSLVIRPHPSEDLAKYAHLQTDGRFSITVRQDRSLMAEIAGADCIVGCNSMAMVVSSWASRLTICAIPASGRGYSLRLPNIIQLQDLPAPIIS